MGIGVTIVVSLLLAAATVVIHYELLQFAGTLPRRLTVPTRPRIIIVIGVVLAAHILEAGLYAAAYYVLQIQLGMGGLGGHLEGGLLDYFYFSMATYTTLGIGDLHPSGVMRLIAGVESLNGLVLIGWSASFTYLTMEELWGRGVSEKRA
ncbi:MAG: ion channel [Hyphomicrobiaceae bacterium]